MTKFSATDFLQKLKPFYIFKIVSSIFSQLSSLFLIYLIKPKEYGYLALIISVAQIMFTLTSGWSNGAVINLGTKNFLEKGTYKNIIFYRGAIVLVCFAIVTAVFFLLPSLVIDIILVPSNLKYVFIFFIGYVCYDFSYQLLYPGNKNNLQAILELICTGSLFAFTILYVTNIYQYANLFLLISFLFFATTVISFLYYFGKDKFKWVQEDFNSVFKYSIWQLMSVLGIYIINLGNNFVFVLNKIPAEDIGIYNFAFKLFSGFSVIFALFGIIIPKWVHNKDFNHNDLPKRVYLITIALAVGFLLLAIVIEPFIKLIGKEDYLGSVKIYYYLFPAFVLMTYVNLMNTIVANSKLYKSAQFAILIQVIVIFVIGYPFVHYVGIYGAIYATTISYLVCSIFFYILFKRKVLKSLTEKQSW